MASPSKRRRQNDECCERCCKHSAKKRKKHLYLVVDDWKGGYSIHKLDADDMEDHLPEHGALRLASSEGAPMAFGVLGTNIFIATNPRCSRDRAPPFLVYDTETAALTVGPPPPDGYLRDLGDAVAVGAKLYALTFFCEDDDVRQSSSLQVLSWQHTIDQQEAWDPAMAWSWDTSPAPAPFIEYEAITSYAMHPDGRTIFMSANRQRTHSLDTSNGVWRDLGEWTLPFRGRAYFDGELDAWVGLHYKEEGYICCCPVASRSATTAEQPECKILEEKLFRRRGEEKHPDGRYLSATLTYMGDSKFCLVECVLRSRNAREAVLHVTVFGLTYDHRGELKTRTRRTTRSYGVSKNTLLFSHATFWM